MNNNDYNQYKIYPGEHFSMYSSYINYFLEGEYECSLPRGITEDTLRYLEKYLIDNYPIGYHNLVRDHYHRVKILTMKKYSEDTYYYVWELPSYQHNTLLTTSETSIYFGPTQNSIKSVKITSYFTKSGESYVYSKSLASIDYYVGADADVEIKEINTADVSYNHDTKILQYYRDARDTGCDGIDGNGDNDKNGLRTYLVSTGDSQYVDRRVLQYLLGYAITENSSCEDIRLVHSQINELELEVKYDSGKSGQIRTLIKNSSPDKYTNELRIAIEKFQEYVGLPMTGYYDRDTEEFMLRMLNTQKGGIT